MMRSSPMQVVLSIPRMAGILGLVTGGITLAHLTGRLLKGIAYLNTLREQYKDLLNGTNILIVKLRLLRATIWDLDNARITTAGAIPNAAVLAQVSGYCQSATTELETLILELRHRISASQASSGRRVIAKARSTLQSSIAEYRVRLRDTLGYVSLAQGSYLK